MRYQRAVERLRLLAEDCQQVSGRSFLREAYVFGEIFEGADVVDGLDVAFALDLPPDDVSWCAEPRGSSWLVDVLGLAKGGIAYRWRSLHEPVWNHAIREPVRFWSLDGTDE